MLKNIEVKTDHERKYGLKETNKRFSHFVLFLAIQAIPIEIGSVILGKYAFHKLFFENIQGGQVVGNMLMGLVSVVLAIGMILLCTRKGSKMYRLIKEDKFVEISEDKSDESYDKLVEKKEKDDKEAI